MGEKRKLLAIVIFFLDRHPLNGCPSCRTVAATTYNHIQEIKPDPASAKTIELPCGKTAGKLMQGFFALNLFLSARLRLVIIVLDHDEIFILPLALLRLDLA